MRPGPIGNPAETLKAAAIEYAAALEDESKAPKHEWDRLVKAALRYRRLPRVIGRPRLAPP